MANTIPPAEWEIWCGLGGVNPDIYGSLASVVASSTAMNTLANSAPAVNYMIATSIIGLAVIGSATAVTALDASSPVTIPSMTSNTAPSGVASASATFSSAYEPYKAMDAVTTDDGWAGASTPIGWIQYRFPSAIWVYKFQIKRWDGTAIDDLVIKCSNNGIDFIDASSVFVLGAVADLTLETLKPTIGITSRYLYWRLYHGSYTSLERLRMLQIYGK